MPTTCCQIVGDLKLNLDACITSINVSSNTETFWLCEEVKLGPTIGTLSVTAIASEELYQGCASKAGVSISWLRKYDCNDGADKVYFINNGEGQSHISGENGGLVAINNSTHRIYPVISANSSSGPTSFYMQTDREDGFGMTYTGAPWAFNTANEDSIIFDNFGVGSGDLYLQSFDLTLTPGEFPTASFSFMFFITD